MTMPRLPRAVATRPVILPGRDGPIQVVQLALEEFNVVFEIHFDAPMKLSAIFLVAGETPLR